jgi:anti-repressor protein
MTAVEIFRAPAGEAIRVVTVDGEPRFVVADLAKMLGYRDASNAARLLRDHQQGYSLVSTPSGQQRMLVTNEAGLNRLILRANTPDADRIQDWITDEVMPSITHTGGYVKPGAEVALGDPLDEIDMANDRTSRAVAIARQERAARLAAEAHAAALEPAAHAWEVLASARGDYSVREAVGGRTAAQVLGGGA